MGLVRFVYLLALALWIGEIVFFSFVAAPAIFRVLAVPEAGAVVSAIFPRYYTLAICAGAAALGAAVVLGRRAAPAAPWTAAVVVLAFGLAATTWAGMRVYPRAQQLRAAAQGGAMGSPAADEFQRLHRRAVALNAASLAGALAGLALSAGALRS